MPEGRAANHAFSVVTLRPPIAAPLPGAVVSFAVISSPASVDYWGEIGERHGLELTVVNPLSTRRGAS